MNSKIIWNTEIVNETLLKLRQGVDLDLGCFYMQNPELKAPNVPFQLTHEEENEFIKCSDDIEHFVETYCKFLTDKGRTLVTLREYQRDILNTLQEEIWIESLKEFGPEVKNYLLMSARQMGKCFLFDTQIVIRNTLTNSLSKITVEELYNIMNKYLKKSIKNKIIFSIKHLLYKFYEYIDKKC